jgi:hypothetical protein
MDRRKMAAMYRRLAELHREEAELNDCIADALTEDDQAPSQPRRRGGSVKSPVLPPEAEVSDEAKMRARVKLAAAGGRR